MNELRIMTYLYSGILSTSKKEEIPDLSNDTHDSSTLRHWKSHVSVAEQGTPKFQPQ